MAIILIAVYACILSIISYSKYHNFNYDDFDLAIHSQSVRNILHGSIDNSILGIPFPGNHMTLILFLIAPVYGLFSSPLLLLYLQSMVLAAGALGIFLLARKELSGQWALGLTAAYLAYPPLIYMNLYEFHPVALATSFLIFMMYFYKTERFGWFILFTTLALLCQENISLLLMAFALYAFIERKRGKWVWVPLSMGVCYFALSAFIIMPLLNRNTIQFWQLYAHLGNSPAQVIKNIIIHPATTFQTVADPDKAAFFGSLFAPLGFLSILNPSTLIPAFPAFCQRILSDRLSETRIIFHYQAEFIPFIFVSAIYGIKRLLECKYRFLHTIPALLLLIFPVSALLLSGLPSLLHQFCLPDAGNRQHLMAQTMDAALRNIPDDVPVAATFRFLPRLANRERLYSLHHIYTGRYTLSHVSYPTPEDIRYVIIDTDDRLTFLNGGFYSPDNYRNLQALISGENWRAIQNIESILVFEKASRAQDRQLDIISLVTDDTAMNTNVTQKCPASIELAGFSLGPTQQNYSAPLTLYWKKLCTDKQEYDVRLTISADRQIYSGILAPGSRIWPTQSWPITAGTNTVIADKHNVYVIEPVQAPDKLQIRATVFPINRPVPASYN